MTEKMTGNTGKKTEDRPAGAREAGTRTAELPQEVRRYADIIGLEHPVSRKHRQMSMTDRAAQFSPFAALTGMDRMYEETEQKSNAPEDTCDPDVYGFPDDLP